MIQFYSKKYKKNIKFESIGELENGKPVVEGFDKKGRLYCGIGIENEQRTIVRVDSIKQIKRNHEN